MMENNKFTLDKRLMLIFGAILIVCWIFPLLIFFFIIVDLIIIFFLIKHKLTKKDFDKALVDVMQKVR